MKDKIRLLIRSYELGNGKTPCVSLWIPADADPEIRKVIAILQLSDKNHEDHDGTIVWEGVKLGDEFTTGLIGQLSLLVARHPDHELVVTQVMMG